MSDQPEYVTGVPNQVFCLRAEGGQIVHKVFFDGQVYSPDFNSRGAALAQLSRLTKTYLEEDKA